MWRDALREAMRQKGMSEEARLVIVGQGDALEVLDRFATLGRARN